MLGMWDVVDVGCWGCGMLIYKMPISNGINHWNLIINHLSHCGIMLHNINVKKQVLGSRPSLYILLWISLWGVLFQYDRQFTRVPLHNWYIHRRISKPKWNSTLKKIYSEKSINETRVVKVCGWFISFLRS